ncbi:glycosyltransferase family 4 protein [Cupriavidus basilensis]|uniref:glycosyltransferase family 4 protein n=1 Tax=Cupriavidus basilensis TaxID=68895 RepID=UPI0023E790A2|nr:glycosyltransferase [Cupriavidus basilensis]MDF3886716.1 glycosyltransferase [Cupriavidus basilensis]
MKIVIVAPSPVPFAIGGAENLWWGLHNALNARPGVQADLIKLPSPERSLPELLGSYQRFAQLDLRHFDLVISTKYPAWAIEHPNHIVYLQHTLRGLYDTYPRHLSTGFDAKALAVLGVPAVVIEALKATLPAGLTVEAVTQALLTAMQHAPEDPLWAFPGPLSRAVVRLLDAIAMQPGRIARFAAISRTVASRQDYFPTHAQVSVHHHPTSLKPSGRPAYDTIFSASRLDRPKRIDKLIEAYVQSGLDVPLRIAGSGPDEARLHELAAGHAGVQFLGRLTDTQLAQEYARALFVPFIPLDEDYGLITVEAMEAGKAVLTTSDSGGPTELVTHRETGLVVEPTPAALAGAMRHLCEDRQSTLEMGMLGASRISALTWDGLCDALLAHSRHRTPTPASRSSASSPSIIRHAKPLVAVVNTFPIAPAVSGGKLRLHGLYTRVSEAFRVHFVNLGPAHLPQHVRALGEDFTEEIVPKSSALSAKDVDLKNKLGASAEDLAAALYPDLVPEWLATIGRTARAADIVVCSHPYGFPALQQVSAAPFIYESHNVEADLKRGIYGRHKWAADLVEWVERRTAWEARTLTACCAEDGQRLRELYSLGDDKRIVTVPNGIHLSAVPYRTADAKARRRAALSAKQPVALFMGSAHGPNVEAAHLILAAAEQLPDVHFVVMGSVCHTLGDVRRPRNVGLLGVVSDAEKGRWLELAEYGLNPILSGSGTNLKLVEYAAAGILIVGTEFGARGAGFAKEEHYLAHTADELAEGLRAAISMDAQARQQIIDNAYARIQCNGDWRSIAETYVALLRELVAA